MAAIAQCASRASARLARVAQATCPRLRGEFTLGPTAVTATSKHFSTRVSGRKSGRKAAMSTSVLPGQASQSPSSFPTGLSEEGKSHVLHSLQSHSTAIPPSLQRLPLRDTDLDSLVQSAEENGLEEAFAQLVEKASLSNDPVQAECAKVLQSVVTALLDHAAQRQIWKQQHEIWQETHSAWMQDMEERRQSLEKKVAEDSSESSGTLAANSTDADKNASMRLEDLLPEPLKPPPPVMDTYGCYVWGPVGGGKSLLMDLFIHCLSRNSDLGGKAIRVHFHEFMQHVHKELHLLRLAGAERTTATVAKRLAAEVKLIAFDEFQITNIADALIVETLLDALFDEGVALVMTTNRPPEDLYKDGLNRHLAIPQLLALFDKRKVIVNELTASRDYRSPDPADVHDDSLLSGPWRDFISKTQSAGQDADADVDARLQSVFEEVAGSASSGPTTVPLPWGRSMTIDKAAEGVGYLSFSELCGSALNADDYLKLADRFHTLLVKDVPRFSMDTHNEARRFTNLIDCLYERHVRLVVSADAPPQQLFEKMEQLTEFTSTPIGGQCRSGSPPPSSAWVRQSPSSAEAASPLSASAAESSGRAGAGDDDTATGASIAGIMTGAVASLQESGFAAKRAVSRLIYMQSEEYLRIHTQHRRQA